MELSSLLGTIGSKIKNVRQRKGISQQDFAAKCNFEKSNMSRIEHGKTNLTIRTLNTIASALEVSVKELL